MSDEERKPGLPPEEDAGLGGQADQLAAMPGREPAGPEEVTRELQELHEALVTGEPPAEPAAEGIESSAPAPGDVPLPEPPAAPEPAPAEAPEASSGRPEVAAGPAAPEGTDDDRLMSALAWFTMAILQLPIVSVIQLMSPATKERLFQRHHAVASLMFYVAAIAYEVLAGIAYAILGTITLGCGLLCLWVIFFVPHALALFYAFQAYSGKRVELPVLSDLARRQNWM